MGRFPTGIVDHSPVRQPPDVSVKFLLSGTAPKIALLSGRAFMMAAHISPNGRLVHTPSI